MAGMSVPLIWAQATLASSGPSAEEASGGGVSNPAALAALALRRWFSGQTLSSPQAVPDLHGFWAFVLGLAALLVLAGFAQGPTTTLRQVLDPRAHLGLVRRATRRVWKAGRLVAAVIAFTVLAWTSSQTLTFLGDRSEKGRADLTVLTRSRATGELALDQGLLAALTPLRDLAALADNLPLLVLAVYLVFRATSGTLGPAYATEARLRELAGASRRGGLAGRVTGWSNLVWGCGSLYALYRLASRFSGSAELPLGGCLVIEAVLIPLIMLLCDGFLLAWVLVELRASGFDDAREERFDPTVALELMPAAALACALAMPARYIATLVMLAYQNLPTSVGTTPVGQFIRWQLGWGLIDVQAASLAFLGLAGVTAWSRGSIAEVLRGWVGLLRSQGGHLVVAVALAGAATCVLAGLIYPLLFLLPPAGWVLPAADSYSHYLTLPAGLWTLSAMIDLAGRSLPVARVAGAGRSSADRATLPEPDAETYATGLSRGDGGPV